MTAITARGPTVVTRDQYNRGRLSCSVCIQWRSQYLEVGWAQVWGTEAYNILPIFGCHTIAYLTKLH